MSNECDARGLKCPLPVLYARRALKSVPVGEVLTVLATDAQAPEDFAHFCRTTGHELLGTEQREGHARISIRKRV
jgi:tRNA 2-thiouridine synthesizing protein A